MKCTDDCKTRKDDRATCGSCYGKGTLSTSKPVTIINAGPEFTFELPKTCDKGDKAGEVCTDDSFCTGGGDCQDFKLDTVKDNTITVKPVVRAATNTCVLI